MSIEVLKEMKDGLVKCVHSQMDHLESVDTKELGEAVDMIKDFSEAIYYCTIIESMEKAEKEQEERPAEVRNVNYCIIQAAREVETKAVVLPGIQAVARVEIPEAHLVDLEAVPAITLL